jgi:Mce-associated membrane protein
VAIACICGLLAASGYMTWHHRQALNTQRSVAEFSAAARQSVVALFSLDFQSARHDVERILDNSTGQFRDDIKAQADDLVKMTEESKVHTEAVVGAAGVQSHTKDSAVVLVAATTTVTSAAHPEKQPRSWRLSVTITRDVQALKMSKVEFVV